MEAVKIILLGVAASIAYGVAHDQVTVRVCVEYFTIGHPALFDTESPTLLALAWGIAATWWIGLAWGIGLALSARAGWRPKLKARQLLIPTGVLLVCTAALALLAGLAGYALARAGYDTILHDLKEMLPPDRHVLFIANAWATWAAFIGGCLGAVTLCFRTWKRRGRLAEASR